MLLNNGGPILLKTDTGKLKLDSQLHPEREAVRLRLDGGKPVLIDGPFAESKEWCGGGFFLIAAEGRDEAIEIAKRCPHLQCGRIEVRQLNTSGKNLPS